MEHIDLGIASLSLDRLGVRLRPKPLGLESEQALTDAPPPLREASLSGYVPSSLISTDRRMLALAVGGAPAWSRRLRRIDELVDQAVVELETAWRELARITRAEPDAFSVRWRERASRQDFSSINDLIRRHNEYFPAEANLPMSVYTGDFIGPGGRDYRKRLLDLPWILARFPPDLARALA